VTCSRWLACALIWTQSATAGNRRNSVVFAPLGRDPYGETSLPIATNSTPPDCATFVSIDSIATYRNEAPRSWPREVLILIKLRPASVSHGKGGLANELQKYKVSRSPCHNMHPDQGHCSAGPWSWPLLPLREASLRFRDVAMPCHVGRF
jgi:hypothetical protein